MMEKLKDRNTQFIWPFLGCIILILLISLVAGHFSINQLLSPLKLASFAMLVAYGEMIVVTSGDGAIDLSLIYILTLSAYLSTNFMEMNPILGVFIALGVGCFLGALNGIINVYLKIPAMVTTLASGYIIFSAILILAPTMNTLPHPVLVKLVNSEVLGIPSLTLFCIFIALALSILLYHTAFGKKLHAVGQNKSVAYYAGINVNRVKIISFILAGGLASLAGILCGAFIGGAFQDMGSTYFLPAIAATFIGGTLASGGKSNVVGVFFGTLMMSLMTTFLNTGNISPGLQRLIEGLFLVILLFMSVRGKNRSLIKK